MKNLSLSKPIVFGAPLIEEAEIREVVATLRGGWVGTGPRVSQFEEDFRRYKGAEFAVAVSSCTAALHLSMLVAGLKPGDEVITSALTFCATVNAIIHSGATPVLADVEPDTMNIDPRAIEACLTPRTKAIVPVHFAGRPCNMDEICRIARKHNLKIIEDCAHAIESEYHARKVGTFGDFGCFSFYVTKNITTVEGGMVLSKRKNNASRIKVLALHGMSKDAWKRFGDEGYKHYFVEECGYKYNMTDLQAAIGIHQLRRIDQWWRRRQTIWKTYDRAFQDLSIDLPKAPEPDTRHAYHLYTILVAKKRCGLNRDAFVDSMSRSGIGVGVHYLSIAEHPYYRKAFKWQPCDYPNARRIGRETVSLPLTPGQTETDTRRVISAVRHLCA